MEKFSLPVCLRQTKQTTCVLVLLFLLSFSTKAQNRNFGIVYSENMRGGSTIFGNTLLNAVNANGSVNITAMNGNSVNGNSLYSNGGNTSMKYIDIDGSTGEGAGTKNSSSADLILPAGVNTIKMARLYWGGRAEKGDFDMSKAVNQRIKIRKGTSGAYEEYAAAQYDKITTDNGTSSQAALYQAFVDITALVKQKGAGTYTVGNAAISTGQGGEFGNYGAWSIVVVYENPAVNFNSVRVFDGYKQVYSDGSATTSSVTLTGLNVPSGELASSDAQLSIMSFEGDSRYNGDFFKINSHTFSNALNPANNSFNGTITNNGVHVTTKNPNYTDQMGIDIDQFNIGSGYGIAPNASSVTLQFGTSLDQYFCGIITFVIKMKDPTIELKKSVADANNTGTAEQGEILTYKLKGKNIGAGNANNMVLTDSLPASISFVHNSIKVNYSPGIVTGAKTDSDRDDIADYDEATRTVTFRIGNNASATRGGYLASADSFEVEFQAIVNPAADDVILPIVNVARLKAVSDAMVEYVDDATAVISPLGGPLPVTLTSFTAALQQPKQVKVTWSTSMEYNCSKYNVERSTDGIVFTTVATRAGSGNSTSPLQYSIDDDISAVNAPIVYYRLNQVDTKGKNSLSKIVSIKLKKANGDFTVSPNPFSSSVNINIEWGKNETTILKVYSVNGTEVIAKNIKMVKGNNLITLSELAQVLPGGYVIQFISDSGKMIKQIIKEK